MPKIVCNALDCEYNTDRTCDCNLIRLNDVQVCQKYVEKTPTDYIKFNDREQLQKHYQHWLQVNGFPDNGANAFAFLNRGHMFYTEKVKEYLVANSNVLLD